MYTPRPFPKMRLISPSLVLWLPLLISISFNNATMLPALPHLITRGAEPEFAQMEEQIRLGNEIQLKGARRGNRPPVVFLPKDRGSRSQANPPSWENNYAHGLHEKANWVLDNLIQQDEEIKSHWRVAYDNLVWAIGTGVHQINVWLVDPLTGTEDQLRTTESTRLLEAAELIEKMFENRATHLIRTQDQSVTPRIAESIDLNKMPFSRLTIDKIDKIFESIDEKLKKIPEEEYRSPNSDTAEDVKKVTKVFWDRFFPTFIDHSLEEFTAMDSEMKIVALENLSFEVQEITQKFANLADELSPKQPVQPRLGKSRLGRFPLGNPPPDDLSPLDGLD
ncbi:hypothetical protein Pst134EA_028863 [Puccinia striiformis f. sp. tritici]|nr:hypothetical protein Pst134EA_028863 [Puccinia striiformis f. sp. tritici]KAH9446875.1 hypothetical protein Pst134EA_028863 [Puccinia striiformis f. sp. tritici]KAI9623434.1 hypothetical protein H4Q26_014603 [Puccinia striiformis f. sp. tritici PST-130]